MFPLSDSITSKGFQFFTIAIILLNCYAFFLQLSSPESFTESYALIPQLVNFSNYQTLIPFITAMFLHGGFFHILSNMWFLWVFGDNVEGYLGHLQYLFVYLLSGIVGSLIQYITDPTSSIPVIGASGAVAGVLGAYYVLFPHAKIKTFLPIFFFFTIVTISAPLMLGYWFLLQLFSGAASLSVETQGGVAFFAHVGGFLTGVLYAKYIAKRDDVLEAEIVS
jgi:membrane associated rhomboid family serine protease